LLGVTAQLPVFEELARLMVKYGEGYCSGRFVRVIVNIVVDCWRVGAVHGVRILIIVVLEECERVGRG
jgi:hypothetical protein